MAQLSEPLVRDAIRCIREERKLMLTINEVDQALHAWLVQHSEMAGQSVPIPRNEAQAEMMAKLGIAWLEANAPHRLRTASETTEAGVGESHE